MQRTLCIENLTLMLRLGFHEFETELPQGVSVDLQVNLAGEVELGPTTDYSQISKLLQDQLQDKVFSLIENLADSMWRLLKDNQIQVTHLKVSKINPPCYTSGVTIDKVSCVISE